MFFLFRLLVISLTIILFIGCSDNFQPRAKGKCGINSDCPNGTHCVGEVCEDIYHPRREIKTY